jgi:hypothetical protein
MWSCRILKSSVGDGIFLSAEGDVSESVLVNSNKLLLAFFPINISAF